MRFRFPSVFPIFFFCILERHSLLFLYCFILIIIRFIIRNDSPLGFVSTLHRKRMRNTRKTIIIGFNAKLVGHLCIRENIKWILSIVFGISNLSALEVMQNHQVHMVNKPLYCCNLPCEWIKFPIASTIFELMLFQPYYLHKHTHKSISSIAFPFIQRIWDVSWKVCKN